MGRWWGYPVYIWYNSQSHILQICEDRRNEKNLQQRALDSAETIAGGSTELVDGLRRLEPQSAL